MRLADAYKRDFEKSVAPMIEEVRSKAIHIPEIHSKARVAPIWVQLRELMKRDLRDIVRNPSVQIIKLMRRLVSTHKIQLP
mmetsp:Transcript_21460/g.18283  ORF Transcript_21460/g.18283 Transcript_21460/m.18283 type:complete len:81 (-) Transcript_21460:136-378(-)